MNLTEIRTLHARVIQSSVAVVAAVVPDDLSRPTPCLGWTLADLLAHMISQHHGFAAAARGDGGNSQVWRTVALSNDPVAQYADASAAVLTAFAETRDHQEFVLPEISSQVPFPVVRAIGFHFVDYVAHTWDVARSIAGSIDFDDEVLAAALRIAEAVPVGPARTQPGAAFAPVIAAKPTDPMLNQVLALLGRSPTWPVD